MKSPRNAVIGRLCIGALLAATATAAIAQDEITITGRHRAGDVTTASIRVNYSDLDMRSAWGRRELNYRIFYAAQDLCNRIADPNEAYAIVDDCRDQAYRDALHRVGTPDAHVAPSYTMWMR